MFYQTLTYKTANARLAVDFLSDEDSAESPLLNIEDTCSTLRKSEIHTEVAILL